MTSLFRLGCAAFAALVVALPARADPAMWVIRDADSTIYLLGTFHLVKPGTDWRSAKMEKALDESAELWLETSGLDNPSAIVPLVMKHGFDARHALSSRLDAEEKAKLDAAAEAAGVTPAALEHMRPWLAAITIAAAPLTRAGYDPKAGVDQTLETEAKAEHKTIRSFETPEEQLLVFANLPEQTEMAFFKGALEDADEGEEQLDRMSALWLDGEMEELNRLSFAKMQAEDPVLYEALILRRNQAWAAKIAEVLQGAGVSFIAVGAGHLAGENSVQNMLTERGIVVERY